MSAVKKALSVFMCFLLLNTMFWSKAPLHAETVSVPPGSTVTLQVNDTISPRESREGTEVKFIVVDGIYAENKMVVVPGAEAIGIVKQAYSNRIIGGAGTLTVDVTSVTAVDGSQIPVHGSITVEGRSNLLIALLVGFFLCPLGCLIHGEDARLLSGTNIVARVSGVHEVIVEP